MIVGHEFLDDLAQVPLAEEDEMVQALVFDGFDDQLADILGFGWTAAPGLRAVVLLRGQLAEPGENRLRLHEPAALAPLVRGELLACGGKATALVCRECELLAARGGVQLFLQNALLFFDVVELALQPIVDRGCDHHDQELQRHGQH